MKKRQHFPVPRVHAHPLPRKLKPGEERTRRPHRAGYELRACDAAGEDLCADDIAKSVPAGTRWDADDPSSPDVTLRSRARALETREALLRAHPGATVRIFEVDLAPDAPVDDRSEDDFDLDADGIYVGREESRP